MGKARAHVWRMARLKQRKLVWGAVVVAELMFFVELIGGIIAGSASLQVDAMGTSDVSSTTEPLLAAKAPSPRQTAFATICSAAIVFVVCAWTIGLAIWNVTYDTPPNAPLMGAIAGIALIANATAATLLFRNRIGSAEAKHAWTSARNDTLGNLAVVAAAVGVYVTSSGWPDAVATVVIAPFALRQAYFSIKRARLKLRDAEAVQSVKRKRAPHQQGKHRVTKR